MCGATCPCWTTGIWCPGWRCLAADTTAWCTTANSTPSEDWEYQGTWTTWRGRKHAARRFLRQLAAGDSQSQKSLTPRVWTDHSATTLVWMLSNPVWANKYSHCAAKRGRWCGRAYCKSGWTGLLAFFRESKKVQRNGSEPEHIKCPQLRVLLRSDRAPLTCLWVVPERGDSLSESRVLYCVGFHPLEHRSATLHVKVVRCGTFSWLSPSFFFLFYFFFMVFLLKLFSIKKNPSGATSSGAVMNSWWHRTWTGIVQIY